MSSITQQAQDFFYMHAGYSFAPAKETEHQGRTRGAKLLAKVEKQAFARGFYFRWSVDPDCNSSDFSDEKPAWQLWQCAMYNKHGRIVNSLHGIDFGRDGEPCDDPCCRVVEAELAIDGLTNTPQ